MSMRLSQLLEGLAARVPAGTDVAVTHVTADSRAVKPGSVFVAVPAASASGTHGMTHAPAAAAAGACVVVCDPTAPSVPPVGVPAVRVEDARAALSTMAERIHGEPSRHLRLLGVTGTNGKTTTAHILEAIAVAAGEKAGFIGTTAVRVAGEERKATHTTPPAEALSALLSEMVHAGVSTCAMEVSSHAIHQKRVEALRYAGAIFTNLTQDHLDYHQTLDAYFEAKARLFTHLLPADGVAVLNADDPRVLSLVGRVDRRTVTFSAEGGAADLRAARVTATAEGTEIQVEGALGRFVLRTPLVGTYNVANVLGAAALHLCCGTSLDAVIGGVAGLARVPGRLDAVEHPAGALVLVDYAHTDDALARALDAVRPRVGPGGRLFCVFGCGGDRDAGKRPRMGEAAARRADVVVVTNDNPRSEAPEAIAVAILNGIHRAGMPVVTQGSGLPERGAVVELDRREAIARAVRAARRGDVVLIAGKGHETEQMVGAVKHPFDDRLVALEAGRAVPL